MGGYLAKCLYFGQKLPSKSREMLCAADHGATTSLAIPFLGRIKLQEPNDILACPVSFLTVIPRSFCTEIFSTCTISSIADFDFLPERGLFSDPVRYHNSTRANLRSMNVRCCKWRTLLFESATGTEVCQHNSRV